MLVARSLRSLVRWYWYEPRFIVRYLAAMAVLTPIALLIRWTA